jgi:predicted hydrocarbon binding protein
MFDQTVVAAFEHLNDGIIVLSLKETRGRFQRFIRVKQSPIPGFFSNEVPYTIVDNRPYLVTTFTEPLSTFRDHVKVEADGSVSLFGSRCIIVDTAIIRSLIEYLTKRASFDIKGAQEEVYNFSKEYGRELLKGFLISTNLRMEDLGSKALFDMFTAFLSTSGVGLLRVGKFSDNLITMKVFNCICGSNQAISQAISPYLRGIIAGVAETLLDGRFKCSETKCMASNEDYCEFECQRLE